MDELIIIFYRVHWVADFLLAQDLEVLGLVDSVRELPDARSFFSTEFPSCRIFGKIAIRKGFAYLSK